MNKKIVDYCILSNPRPVELQMMVLDKMKKDWQPLGGIATCERERSSELPFSTARYYDSEFLQVMVKYED